MPCPTPCPAPVTSATLPSRNPMESSFLRPLPPGAVPTGGIADYGNRASINGDENSLYGSYASSVTTAVSKLSPAGWPARSPSGIVAPSMVGSDHPSVLVKAQPLDHSG